MTGRIVVLNGAGSVVKSSVSRDPVRLVYRDVSCDPTVDCDATTPEAAAALICERFAL